MKTSIFNDVIGPVMRGPSSSHCAGALRIGRLIRDLMNGTIFEVYIRYDIRGSLASTHKGQGTDMGLCGGLLGWDADDSRLPDFEKYINKFKINIKIEYADLKSDHPNTFFIRTSNNETSIETVALSTGGGMIEIIELNGTEISISGGSYELLICTSELQLEKDFLVNIFQNDEYTFCNGQKTYFHAKSYHPFSQDKLSLLKQHKYEYLLLNPVLPVLSRKSFDLPFRNCQEMLEFNKTAELDLADLAIAYESARSGLSKEEVIGQMLSILNIMKTCLQKGSKGTTYQDRILGAQSLEFKDSLYNGKLATGGVFNLATLYVSAIMESKSSMEVIVAAPTAGSCGVVPGVCLALSKNLSIDEVKTAKSLLVAGIIGTFIITNATFAAEDAGCMAECGSAAGMAAAATVYLMNGSVEQCISAASMALQNSFGMICDPIANRVEAPCLGKNVMSAMNALSCANMSLSNYDSLIPLDEVIDAMDQVGKRMPAEHCCTGKGGIATTPTGQEIEKSMSFIKSC